MGGRGADYASEFMAHVASRLANRFQLTTDHHKAHLEAVEGAFGVDVDYAVLVKMYGNPIGDNKTVHYSSGDCIGSRKTRSRAIPMRAMSARLMWSART
jgi:hypothetical protein